VETYTKVGSNSWLFGSSFPIEPPNIASTAETAQGLDWKAGGDFSFSDGSTDSGLFFRPDFLGTITTAPPPTTPQTNALVATLLCPADLSVYDSAGRHDGFNTTTGTLDIEIPDSSIFLWEDIQCISIRNPDSHGYSIILDGTAVGNYTLVLNYVTGNSIYVSVYDGNISQQEKQIFAALVSESGLTSYRGATVSINPASLNLGSKGNWITSYIEIAKSFDMRSVNVSSILLNGTIPVASLAPVTIGDYNNNGIPDLMVKFDRQAVSNLILANWKSSSTTGTVTLAGTLNDGTPFQGSTTITVILPPSKGYRGATPI
jgi:hypothetical protein